MSIGAGELLIFVMFFLILMAFPIWGIIDAAKRSDSDWAAADQSKVVWILVQVFLWIIGTIAYALIVRPKLQTMRESTP